MNTLDLFATKTGATFSQDGRHRYTLTREVCQFHGGRVLFVMLNPSTADASVDDPTIRRCIGFAKAWEMGDLHVANLFSLRSTDPKALYENPEDATGDPANLGAIQTLAGAVDLVVCAWGTHGALMGRGKRIAESLRRIGEPCYLGLTKDGHPRHPLYLKADLKPERWVG